MSADSVFVKEVGKALDKMGVTNVTKDADGRVNFELEAPPTPGELPERVIDELMHVRTIAKDYASSYSEAVKTQAEKYKINVAAVKRFIAAKCDDKLQEVSEEADDLARLLDKAD